ncbi:MAG: hypothetical protein RSE91_04165, partial [Bacilli bacterium]
KTKMQYGALEAAIINYNGASTVSLQNEALKQGMTVVREMFHLNETVSRNIIPDDVTLALPAVNYIVGLAKPKAIGLTSMEQEKLDVEVSTCNHAKNKFIDMEADQAIMLQNKSLEETADLYEVNTKGDTETPDVTLVKEDPKFEQYKLLTDPLMMSLSGFNVNLEPEKANLDFASHENKPDTKVNGNGGATTTTKPKTTTVSEKDLPSVLAKLPPEKKKEVEAKIEKQKEDINIKLDIKNDPNYLKGYADAGQAVYNSTYNNVYNKKNKMSDDLLWVNASNAALALKEGKVVNYQKGVTDMVSSEQANLGATYSSFYLGKKDARDRLSKEEAARIFNENPPVHYDPGYEYLNDGNQNSNDGYYPPTGGSTITEGEIHDNGVQDRPDFGNTTTSATSIQNSSRDAYVENIISNMESNPQSYVDSSTDIKTR